MLSWSWWLRGISGRAYWVRPWLYAGEVGEGWAMELGDICAPVPRDAVRCEDAATAAAEGSKEAWSTSARCSWMVGEGFLGADPRNSFLVENLRDRLLPVRLSAVAGGDVMCSWVVGRVGSVCCCSLSMRTSGRISSRSRLFSSMTRLRSSRRWRSSDSAVWMRSSRACTTRITLAKSSWVGGASCADVSAAENVSSGSRR